MKLAIVTANAKKYQQIAEQIDDIVEPYQLVCGLDELQMPLIEEISHHKCVQAREHFKQPVLVDDSGIYFCHYNNFPGSMTKWLYEGVGLNGIKHLFENGESTRAIFQCVLSYMDETLEMPKQFIGNVEGELRFSLLEHMEEEPKLPYDLIFKPDEMETVVSLNMEKRKNISHRGKAVQKLKTWLQAKIT